MNPLYQQLNQTGQTPTINPQAMISKMLQNNPNLKPIMDLVKNGANPKDLFYNLARQKGVDPESILSQLR